MHKEAMNIGMNKDSIQAIFESLTGKNKMIKQQQGRGMPLQELESKWREFEALFGIFEQKIQDQKKKLAEMID
jgi:hypothetical protein